MNFSITVFKPDGSQVPLPHDVNFSPQMWAATAVGGPELASVDFKGRGEGTWQAVRWLGHKIKIYNGIGDLVWYGHISEVNVNQGAFSTGITLESMSNRIRVAYTYTFADGSSTRGNTDWMQNDDSVNRYGAKELQHSGGDDMLAGAADELRDSLIDQLGVPIPSISAGQTIGQASGTLTCKGDFSLLDWQYYTELRGLEESNTSGNSTVSLGLGFTASFGWIGEDEEKELWTVHQVMDGLEKGMIVDVIDGANAGTYTIDSNPRGKPEVVVGDVDFTGNRTISDEKGITGKWANGDVIQVSGSNNNDGYRRVDAVVNKERIEVRPKTISTSLGNTNVTIQRGYSVNLVEKPPNHELYGVTSTIFPHGYIIAQSFTLTNNTTPWTCDSIAIRILKIGNPTDSIKVELRTGGATHPGATILATQVLSGTEIFDTSAGWYEFNMGNAQALTYGTIYWIMVSRTGVAEFNNYYKISVDEDVPYAIGSLKMYSVGANSWADRTVNATMPFIVRGKDLITDQITNIVSNYAQFVTDVEILDSSTVETNQYRIGDTTALVELKDFLEMGVNGGRRYICHMTPERHLIIEEEPAPPDYPQVAIKADGKLGLSIGGVYPEGRLPAGQWVDVQSPYLVDSIAKLTPYFVERAEYSASNGQTRIEPRRADPYDIRIRQG